MSAKHTPGPWYVTNVGWVASGQGATICGLYSVAEKRAGANGHLIAAAPDLLDACVALLAEKSGAAQLSNACLQARDAIAKATGDTK